MGAEPRSTEVASPPACRRWVRRDRRIATLEPRLVQFEERVATLARAAKRPAAPFSQGPPQAHPPRPGRKAGADYGTQADRVMPPTLDEVYEAPLPQHCPHGDGVVWLETVAPPYPWEIPRPPLQRPCHVYLGPCPRCPRRVQGRQPRQTSEARGCGASPRGPEAQAAIVHRHQDGGLSQGKISPFCAPRLDLDLRRGGACPSMWRTAGKCLPHYPALGRRSGPAPGVVPAETRGRVGGLAAWLHPLVTPHVGA